MFGIELLEIKLGLTFARPCLVLYHYHQELFFARPCLEPLSSRIVLTITSIILSFDYKEVRHFSQFKFMKTWTLYKDYEDIASKTWETIVVGCPMLILDRKLKLLKIT